MFPETRPDVSKYPALIQTVLNNDKRYSIQIDKEDRELYYNHTWTINLKGYLDARINWKLRLFHRIVMGLQEGDNWTIDHLNHDTVDNRKINLKIVSHRENNQNRLDHGNYPVGVIESPRKDGFIARIYINGNRKHLGRFSTPEEASLAYQKESKALRSRK